MALVRSGGYTVRALIWQLGYAFEHVMNGSHRTLVGRQDARTLLYNIKSSVGCEQFLTYMGGVAPPHTTLFDSYSWE